MSPRSQRAPILHLHADLGRIRVEIVSSTKSTLRTCAHLDEQHIDDNDAVLNQTILSLADLTARHGAAEAIGQKPSALRTATTASAFFSVGAGAWLVADAIALHETATQATWRVSLSRGTATDNPRHLRLIAECTLTFHLPAPAHDRLREATQVSVASEAEQDSASLHIAPTARPIHQNGGTGDSVADQRRRQIFLGACKVISERGYAATTIREIAKASGLPIATMYQYITSKEDILFMITKGCMAELFTYFEQSMVKGGRATDKIKDAIENHIRYISKNRKYINLVYRETKSLNRENREKIFDLERELVALWERIIVDGKKSGEFSVKDPFLAANAIYFLCNIWALRHWIIGDRSEKEVRDMVSLFSLAALTRGKTLH